MEEAEVSSDEEFMEYAKSVLKAAHGDEYDEDKATKTAEGILKKADGDYGAAIGMLTSGLGESSLNEAVKCPWKFRLWVDGDGGIEKYVPGRGFDTAKGTFNDESWEDDLDEFRNEDQSELPRAAQKAKPPYMIVSGYGELMIYGNSEAEIKKHRKEYDEANKDMEEKLDEATKHHLGSLDLIIWTVII